MLKTSYEKLEDIPESQRGAYVQRDGKYVLDDLSDDHPVVTHKKSLERDLSSEKGKVTKLTNDKAQLEQNVIPAGQKAVPEADVVYIEKLKPLGAPDEIATKLGEHKTLKEKDEERAAETLYERAAKELGYENVGTFKAVAKSLKLDIKFKPEKVDGKDVEKPYVGDKALADHIAATPELRDAEVVFRTKPQAPPPPSTEAGAGNRATAAGAGAGNGTGGAGDKKEPTYRFQQPGDVQWPD